MKAPIMFDDGFGTKIPITRDFTRSIHGQKINCIKAYRACTGLGLKDSKDAIEANNATVETLLNLFSPFFPDSDSEPKTEPLSEKQKILNGVGCALDHWKTLGFRNHYDAARIVIGNFENNPF